MGLSTCTPLKSTKRAAKESPASEYGPTWTLEIENWNCKYPLGRFYRDRPLLLVGSFQHIGHGDAAEKIHHLGLSLIPHVLHLAVVKDGAIVVVPLDTLVET